jgi:hypothetical protein
MSSILVGLDLSSSGRAALQWAAQHACFTGHAAGRVAEQDFGNSDATDPVGAVGDSWKLLASVFRQA